MPRWLEADLVLSRLEVLVCKKLTTWTSQNELQACFRSGFRGFQSSLLKSIEIRREVSFESSLWCRYFWKIYKLQS